MRVLSLSLSLFWRTTAIYLLLGLPVILVLFLLDLVGIDPRPNELQLQAIYIQAKPSMIYIALAAALFLSKKVLHAHFHRIVWGERLHLTKRAWCTVTYQISLWFIFLATLNAAVAKFASIDTWVTYKLFGALIILLVAHVAVARNVLALPPGEA